VAEEATPKRYRLADPKKRHVKAKPPRAGGAGRGAKPRWNDDGPPRGPRREFDGPPRGPRREFDGPKREWTDRPPRREFDGPKREWTDRPPSRGPRRDFDGPPRGRSFGGPKREWTDRPPRRDFGDRAPRPAGGGNAEVMEALSRIESSLKDLTKRITLIENQLDEIFDGSEE